MLIGGEGTDTNDVVVKPPEDFTKVLDEKLSVFGRDVKQSIDDVKQSVTRLEQKAVEPEPEEEWNEDVPLTKEKLEEITEKRATKIVDERLAEKDRADDFKTRSKEWFGRAVEEFPDLKDRETPLWKKAGEVYNSLSEQARGMEDVVYICASRAEAALKKEAEMKKGKEEARENVNSATSTAGSSDDTATEDGVDLTAQQKKFCKIHKIDVKKYAARVAARQKNK